MMKRALSLITLLTLILGACSQNSPSHVSETGPAVTIIAAKEPIQVVADGQKIALWAESSPPDALFFWRIEKGVGILEDETSEAIYYVAPQDLENSEQVVVLVEITDAEGNTATDRKIIQLIPATSESPPVPPKPTDTPTPTSTLRPTDTPEPTITPSPTHTPIPPPTPTATPEPCSLAPVHLPLTDSSISISAEFIEPVHCTTDMKPGFLASGTYTGDLSNKELWVFVIPELDLRYYVQSPDACVGLPANKSGDASGAKWNTLVSLGGPPQKYDIAVFVTEVDSESSLMLKTLLTDSCIIKSLPGYTQPEMEQFDLVEIGSITVSKTEESND